MEKEKKYYWTIPVVQTSGCSSMTTYYGHVETYEEALKIKPIIVDMYKKIGSNAEVQEPIKEEEYTRYINGEFVYGVCEEDKKYYDICKSENENKDEKIENFSENLESQEDENENNFDNVE